MGTTHGPRWSFLCLVLLVAGFSPAAFGARRVAPGQTTSGKGRVFMTVTEALELAFPYCEVARKTVFLDDEQLERARKLARVEVDSKLLRPYVARRNGKLVGTAYFDSHKVRTHRETLMFVVDPDARIRRVELLAFGEPDDYIPMGKWYAQFPGKKLDENLSLKRDIRGITGATLSARATTHSARRVLALHAVSAAKPPPPPKK